MTKKALIIVESPAKIKVLRKFLGSNYLFESSVGHIRDLPEKEFGIDIANNFEPKYATIKDKEEVIAKLQKAAKQCEMVYLSPDPDREGEAIAWHISQILPPNSNYKRVSFNSITKDAVSAALKAPRDINTALVNAQQARRLLDRIVGYKISPLLNRRIQRGKKGFVSAGRVQSVALKLVVDREKEIEAFKPVEYWNLAALLESGDAKHPFRANLYSIDGKRVEKEAVAGKEVALIPNKEEADKILSRLRNGSYIVLTVDKKEKKRNPPPPFITSTLQQEASRHYGFSSARTMSLSQSLYEGIDLGNEGAEGLITYMRTDSVRIAPEAIAEARKFIASNFGDRFLPEHPKSYSSKKSAQDAHEAIRPTNLNHPPEIVERYLTRDQFLLYQLIWRRFLACQITSAIYDTVSADISAGDGLIVRATGSTLKFQGYLVLYQEKNDDDDTADENKIIPPLEPEQQLDLHEVTCDQAFTRPPPRYTEASLVKELERSGIGRPSTYAAIMNKIQSRDYTSKENNRLKPTEIGRVIADLLENNFQQIMDIGFTAAMEDNLESVADGEKDWKLLLAEFWKDFSPTLELAEKGAFVPKLATDIDCPECGAKLQKIWFKSKYFYGCSSYPECSYSAPIEELSFKKEDYAEEFDWEQPCPKCSKPMKLRHGRFGPFLGCTDYPQCKGIVNIPKKGQPLIPQQEMPPCPAIGCSGTLVQRTSRYGKPFFSCSTFPDCDVIANNLELLATKYNDHRRTPYVAKTKGRFKKKSTGQKESSAGEKEVKRKTSVTAKSKKPNALPEKKSKKKEKQSSSNQPKVTLSPQLAAIVGGSAMARTEVMKKVWEYIKEKNLQDPNNRRNIVPDLPLAEVFGSNEPVNMLSLLKILNRHFS